MQNGVFDQFDFGYYLVGRRSPSIDFLQSNNRKKCVQRLLPPFK